MSDPHHEPPSEPPHDQAFPLNPETARIVLQMDQAISAFRAGKATGIRALDSASRMMDDLADEVSARAVAPGAHPPRNVPGRPDRIELAILAALADTYGSELLTNASLGYVLRLLARHGGVAFVQRVLWGESASDAQLSVMLTATRAAFTQISLAFPDVFLAEANAVIAACRVPPRPRPPGDTKAWHGGRG
jgi:hypothetical protein